MDFEEKLFCECKIFKFNILSNIYVVLVFEIRYVPL